MRSLRGALVSENPRLARNYEQAETDVQSMNVGHRHHGMEIISQASSQSFGCATRVRLDERRSLCRDARAAQRGGAFVSAPDACVVRRPFRLTKLEFLNLAGRCARQLATNATDLGALKWAI